VKYMVMMFGSAGEMIGTQDPQWIRDMIAFMQGLDAELRESGEMVHNEGLTDATEAKVVSFTDGSVVVSDGPYAEAKESLIGWWVLDVASEERIVEIAGRIAEWSGQVEVRRVADAPPEV
jgi:hypothetical protein